MSLSRNLRQYLGVADINQYIDVNGHRIMNMGDPINNQDAATKIYADNILGNAIIQQQTYYGTGLVQTGSTVATSSDQSHIVKVGTLNTGTWCANTIGVNYGGTGQTNFQSNKLLLGNGSNSLLTTTNLTYNVSEFTVDTILNITNTTDSPSIGTGGMILLGGASIAKNLNVGQNVYISGDITCSNIKITGTIDFAANVLTAVNSTISNLYSINLTSGSINTSNLTSGNIYTSNISGSNIISTNISTSNISTSKLVSTSITSSNIYISNTCTFNTVNSVNLSTINIMASNITASNILITGISSTNLKTTNATISTLVLANGTFSNITLSNMISSNITTANINITANSIMNNVSISNLIVINNTIGSFNASNGNITNITNANILGNNISYTNSTITNTVISNSTISSIINTNIHTTNITSSGVCILNTVNASNLSTGNINVSNMSAMNYLTANNTTIGSMTLTNLNISGMSGSNIISQNISSSNLSITNTINSNSLSANNLYIGNTSTISNIYTLNINASNITSNSVLSSTISTSQLISTNISTSTLRVNGISILTSVQSVNLSTGNIAISSNLSVPYISSNQITTGTIISTNMSASNISGVNITNSNLVNSAISSNNIICSNLSTSNLAVSTLSSFNYIDSTINSASTLLSDTSTIGVLYIDSNLIVTNTIELGANYAGDPATASCLTIYPIIFTDNVSTEGSSVQFWTSNYIGAPTLSAENSSIGTILATALYIQGAPLTGANETIMHKSGISIGYVENSVGSTLNGQIMLERSDSNWFGSIYTEESTNKVVIANASLSGGGGIGLYVVESCNIGLSTIPNANDITPQDFIIFNETSSYFYSTQEASNSTTGSLVVYGGIGSNQINTNEIICSIGSIGNMVITTSGNISINGTFAEYPITITNDNYGLVHTSPDNIIQLATFVGYSQGSIGTKSDHVFSLMTNDTPIMFIASNGVGINTSSPNYNFEVKTIDSSYGFAHTTDDIQMTSFIGNSSANIGTVTNNDLMFLVNGNQICTVNTGGNVVINTDPNGNYGLIQSDTIIQLATFVGYSQGSIGTKSDHVFSLMTNDTPIMFITSNGIGINTSSPTFQLEVNTTDSSYGFAHTTNDIQLASYIGNSSANIGTVTNNDLVFLVNGNQTCTVSTSGNVVINTDPNNTNGNYGLIHTDTIIQLATFVGYSQGSIGTKSTHDFSIMTNDTPQMTIDVNGFVGINNTAPVFQLEVSSTNGNYGIAHTTNDIQLASYIDGTKGSYGTISNNPLSFMTNATEQVIIDTAGNMTINGGISKAYGSFDIPHPLVDNELSKKRLVFSFIEGPRADLIFRGVIKLNNGVASINLDSESTESGCEMTQGTYNALTFNNASIFLQNNSSFNRIIGTISNNILTITCEDTNSSDTIAWMVVSERIIKGWNRSNETGHLVTEYYR